MTLLAITHDEISATVNAADRGQHQLTRHDHNPIIRTGMERRMFVWIMRDLVVTSPPCGADMIGILAMRGAIFSGPSGRRARSASRP